MILSLTAITFAIQAQPGQRGQRDKMPSIEERVDRAKEKLSLSDEQAEQWTAIFEKYDEQLNEARKNRDRDEGQKLRTALNEELSEVLSDDQKEKFAEMQKKGPRPGGRKGN